MRTSNLTDRLLARSVRDGECLRWSGATNNKGYGVIGVGASKLVLTHRAAYESWVGPIPEGYEIDHVRERGCRHRDCLEPRHLEAVTHQENLRRAQRSRCSRGHLLSGDNLKLYQPSDSFVRRVCRACVQFRNSQRAKSGDRNADLPGA